MDARARPAYRPLPGPPAIAFSTALFPNAPPSFVIRLVLGLRRFLVSLADRLCPAEVVMFDYVTGLASSAMLGAVARHDIVDLLEERGPLDAATIAKERSLDADAAHRTMRSLSSSGFFVMSHDGRFSNTRLSRTMRSGQLSRMREWALYFSSGSNASSWLDYAATLETGQSAFTRIHGMTVWNWFNAHPDEREMFAHAMMGLTVMDAPVIASNYPFKEVTRLCDVGGGRGTLLSEILKRHENVKGVLCDDEGVIESAKTLLASRGVADRVELVAGNFFEKVPSGCDTYLLKNILHDWDDATCRKILGVVRAAMTPGARVLLCEVIVDRNATNFMGTRADLQMMIACDNGRERSVAELRALLEKAGFSFSRAFPSATVSVVEGIAVA